MGWQRQQLSALRRKSPNVLVCYPVLGEAAPTPLLGLTDTQEGPRRGCEGPQMLPRGSSRRPITTAPAPPPSQAQQPSPPQGSGSVSSEAPFSRVCQCLWQTAGRGDYKQMTLPLPVGREEVKPTVGTEHKCRPMSSVPGE